MTADLPLHIDLALREIGIVQRRRAAPAPKPRELPSQPWKPLFDGDEPPF